MEEEVVETEEANVAQHVEREDSAEPTQQKRSESPPLPAQKVQCMHCGSFILLLLLATTY